MSAGDTHKFLWRDSTKYLTPTEMSAPEYVEQLMDWAESQLNDESIFPLQVGMLSFYPFPYFSDKQLISMDGICMLPFPPLTTSLSLSLSPT